MVVGDPPDLRLQQMSPARIVALLPEAAQNVLRGRDWNARGAGPGCFAVTTDEARSLAKALDGAGPAKKGRLNYKFNAPGPSRQVWIGFNPYLPHGETTCWRVRMSSRVLLKGERMKARVVAPVSLAVAVLVVVVGAASAFGTVRGPFGDEQHFFKRSFFDTEGKRGIFGVRILSNRSWRIAPEPTMDGASNVDPTGQYVQVTGRGRVVRIGDHAQAWHARLEGFVTRPGDARQRVVITMKGRPEGVFVLTPAQPGVLKRDSGRLTYTGATG